MQSNLEYFFKTTYAEDGTPIVEFGAQNKLQKLHEKAYIDGGEWVRFTEPIDQIEHGESLGCFYGRMKVFMALNKNVLIQPHELGSIQGNFNLPDDATEAFFRVYEHPSQICFFIHGKEKDSKTILLVYIPFDEGHLDLWNKIRSSISG